MDQNRTCWSIIIIDQPKDVPLLTETGLAETLDKSQIRFDKLSDGSLLTGTGLAEVLSQSQTRFDGILDGSLLNEAGLAEILNESLLLTKIELTKKLDGSL